MVLFVFVFVLTFCTELSKYNSYFSNPATKTSRTHMTLKKSTDDGNSWQFESLIWEGPAAYSLLVPLADAADSKQIGVVYEGGFHQPEENMTIAIYDVAADDEAF
jgi:sialidase-1